MAVMYRINTPNVISEPMEREQVVINLDSGCYYSLNESAAVIWRLIETGYEKNEMIEFLLQQTGTPTETISTAIKELLAQLLQEQLITEIEKKIDKRVANIQAPVNFGIPSFQKFDDMQAMLLLDPIHEVSEAGWPNLPEGNIL